MLLFEPYVLNWFVPAAVALVNGQVFTTIDLVSPLLVAKIIKQPNINKQAEFSFLTCLNNIFSLFVYFFGKSHGQQNPSHDGCLSHGKTIDQSKEINSLFLKVRPNVERFGG